MPLQTGSLWNVEIFKFWRIFRLLIIYECVKIIECSLYYGIVIDNITEIIHLIKQRTCFHASIKYLAGVAAFG